MIYTHGAWQPKQLGLGLGSVVLSGTLPAVKVSNLLDRYFGQLDRLCVKHGLFKVEVGSAHVLYCTR